MSESSLSSELTKEQRVLIAMRKTLAAIIKDVTPQPGMRHPLSDATVEDVRQCFGLIAAREKELADVQGRGGERPYYTDQPGAAQTVPIGGLGGRGGTGDAATDHGRILHPC